MLKIIILCHDLGEGAILLAAPLAEAWRLGSSGVFLGPGRKESFT